MVAAPELVRTIDVGNVLGEAVLWNDRRRSVWWTDIQNSRLFEYDLQADAMQSWDMPHRVACFGFLDDDDRLIVAFDHGIAFFHPPSGATEWLVGPDALDDGLRFNDGKVDPMGRFWVGTMVEDPAVAVGSGALYCLHPDYGLLERINDVEISNGLCWSPEGTVMYHADSPKGSIQAYRFDPDSGVLSEPGLFATVADSVHPDGSTVDADGGVWNAQWGGGRVVRYGPDGRESLVIELPVRQPTCVAFGGEDLDLLFVTSARVGLSKERLAVEPNAGNVFIYRTNARGLPANRFKASSPR